VRLFFIRTLFFIVSVSLAVATADLFFKWYWKIPAPGHGKKLIRYEPSLSPEKRLNPNIDVTLLAAYREYRYRVTTNADGFRNTTPLSLNQRDNHDIILLGDSQTFGTGTNDDETFASLLSKQLNQSVLNTAVPGYNSIEQLLLILELLTKNSPKVVVRCFFVGNDPYENFRNRMTLTSDSGAGEPVHAELEDAGSVMARVKDYLKRRSSLYNGLVRLRRIEWVNDILFRFGLVRSAPPGEIAVFEKASPNKEKFWQITERVLLEMNRVITEHGSQFVVLLIPDKIQIDEEQWRLWAEKYQLNPDGYDLMAPNTRLRNFALAHGISFVDATHKFKRLYGEGRNPYWRIDTHIRGEGHKAIAATLYDQIKILPKVSQ